MVVKEPTLWREYGPQHGEEWADDAVSPKNAVAWEPRWMKNDIEHSMNSNHNKETVQRHYGKDDYSQLQIFTTATASTVKGQIHNGCMRELTKKSLALGNEPGAV